MKEKIGISWTTKRKVILIMLALFCLVPFYPREVTLAPPAEITVYSDDGRVAENVEVSRNSNSYMGDGWKATVVSTDQNGKVKFKAITRRLPLIAQAYYFLVAPLNHSHPGNAGSFNARDPQDHKMWARVDYDDSNCCPSEIVMKSQETELDSTFIFGDLVPDYDN